MSDIAALVAGNLDIWTSAIQRKSGAGRGGGKRISLYGIERLRALILDLAVRGKLVPQDAREEPARELLKKFKAQRAVWISEKSIRKGKLLEKLSDDECRFSPPIGWEWTCFGHLGDWGAGATPNRKTSSYYGGETPWFKSGELVGDYISLSEETVTELALRECSLRLNAPGDVLIAMYGATIGKTSILEVAATTNQAVCACTPFDGVFNRYLLLMLKAMRRNFIGQGAGGAQPNISREKIIATPLCLPPFAEQRRIVAKVDGLMTLCDALERESADAMAAHQALVEELLSLLVNSADAADLAANWTRLETHFDTLFTTDASIEALKQTILNLAVRGKLVEQDAGDEPAGIMLAAAKNAAKKAGFKAKMHPPVKPSERPFTLPESWQWECFDHLIQPDAPIAYGVLVPGDDQPDGIPFVRIADLSITDPPALPEKAISPDVDAQYERTRIKGGEILMGVVGSIGKLGVAPDSWAGANIARAICRIVPASFMDKSYVLWLLQSKFMQDSFKGDTRTLAQPTLNLTLIRLAATPIPPIAEQKRIVAKVDALMALCDQLKARLADAAQTQRHLADAITERAAA